MQWNDLTAWFKALLPPPAQLYSETPDLLGAAELAAIESDILTSPFLAKNVLNYNFEATQGFSVIFKSAFKAKVLEKFPVFAPYLQQVVQSEYNLYYLNVLVLESLGYVARHIDHSIRGYNNSLPYPKQVSVLYITVPPMVGGDLILYNHKGFPLKQLKPQTNKLVQFRGNIKHSITQIQELEPGGQRISLVCEQYALSRSELSYVPDYTIKSTADFSAFLAGEIES